jgi:GNAT superfamily N-acetyltransferase
VGEHPTTWRIGHDEDEARAAIVMAQTRAPYVEAVGEWDSGRARPLHCFAFDEGGALIGGVVARTNAIPAWLEVLALWVAPERRQQGVGRALMKAAEEMAQCRGCRWSRLATAHFQAPGFYERVGYRRYGRLEDCPEGVTVFYYTKQMGSAP